MIPLILLGLLLGGCDSQSSLRATPPASSAIAPATVTPSAAGNLISIEPSSLPAEVQTAESLALVLSGMPLSLTRSNGRLVTTLPPTARLTPGVDGRLRVAFVVDQRRVRVVTLQL